MTTLNVNTITPAGATLTLGESGDSVVFADDVKVNTVKDVGENTLWVSNGSGVLSSVNAGIGGADKLLSTQTISNAASASITSGFDSTYKEYIIKWVSLQPVSDGTWFQWQASTDGGSNYNTACTTTIFTAQHNENGSGGALQYNPGQDAAQSTGYIYTSGSFGNAADECGVITIHLFNPSSTTYVKNWYLEDQHYQGDNWSMNIFTAGYYNTSSAINAVNFKFVTGNINAGTLKLYGIAS